MREEAKVIFRAVTPSDMLGLMNTECSKLMFGHLLTLADEHNARPERAVYTASLDNVDPWDVIVRVAANDGVSLSRIVEQEISTAQRLIGDPDALYGEAVCAYLYERRVRHSETGHWKHRQEIEWAFAELSTMGVDYEASDFVAAQGEKLMRQLAFYRDEGMSVESSSVEKLLTLLTTKLER